MRFFGLNWLRQNYPPGHQIHDLKQRRIQIRIFPKYSNSGPLPYTMRICLAKVNPRAFFALWRSRDQSKKAGEDKVKQEQKKQTHRARKKKGRISTFSSLCHTTLKNRFQSPNSLERRKSKDVE
jgi:hypothetical protein